MTLRGKRTAVLGGSSGIELADGRRYRRCSLASAASTTSS